jgi:branched-chain amino acid transport system permease protein
MSVLSAPPPRTSDTAREGGWGQRVLRTSGGPWGALIVVALGALIPQLTSSSYILSVGFQAEILMCLALGLNIVVGYAGLLDLGFAAFFAIGAYTTGLLTTKLGWPVLATLPLAVVVALVGAVFVGVPTLRLRSDYLAVITLGFGEIIQATVNNLSQTGGATGIFGIPPLTIGSLQIITAQGYFYVFLVLLALFIVVCAQLRNSRLGRAWLCIREDEDAAEAMGIKTRRYKLYAYMAGAVLGALTGSFYAPALTAIAPPSFGFNESLLILMAVAIGGMGSIWGAVLGGGIVEILPELFRQFAQARFLVFGVVLIVMMILRPHGLLPEGALRGMRKLHRPRGGPDA